MQLKTACSLFSGCGGDTLGMENANIKVEIYSEIQKVFQGSHEANFEESKLLGGDILKVKDEDIEQWANKLDIVFAGFPCQSFSNAGKKDPNDPRGQLFKEFARVVKFIKPKVLIGENVKGLLTRTTKNDENVIDIIKEEFEKLNYSIVTKVYKLVECGVPQKRERLIILGIRNDLNITPVLPDFNFPRKGLLDIVEFSMKGAIKVDEKMFEDIPTECIVTNMENTESEDAIIHPFLRQKANERDVNYKESKAWAYSMSFGKRVSPNHCEIVDIRNPSKTIICTYERQPRLFVPLKNSNGYFLRPFLPDELKQIQGFPKNYILCGKDKEKIVQVGNAVPPKLITDIVNCLKAM
jgi:DNA (cytosine-5)-methyltransferase 1